MHFRVPQLTDADPAGELGFSLNTVLDNGVAIAGSNGLPIVGWMACLMTSRLGAGPSRARNPEEIASVAAGAQIPESTAGFLLTLGLLAGTAMYRRRR